MTLWTILTTVAVMAFLGFAVFAGPASGAEPARARPVLSFADLDLATAAGADAALARVDLTVRSACKAPASGPRHRRCAVAAVKPALAGVGDPVAAAIVLGNRDLIMFVAAD